MFTDSTLMLRNLFQKERRKQDIIQAAKKNNSKEISGFILPFCHPPTYAPYHCLKAHGLKLIMVSM